MRGGKVNARWKVSVGREGEWTVAEASAGREGKCVVGGASTGREGGCAAGKRLRGSWASAHWRAIERQRR